MRSIVGFFLFFLHITQTHLRNACSCLVFLFPQDGSFINGTKIRNWIARHLPLAVLVEFVDDALFVIDPTHMKPTTMECIAIHSITLVDAFLRNIDAGTYNRSPGHW